MRVLDIIPNTVVDGPHLRTSLYVSGCRHKCKGCHNPESWNFDNGKEMTVEEIAEAIVGYGSKYVTISGGDPMYSAKECSELCGILRERVKDIDIWVYTGFTIEELREMGDPYVDKFLSLVNTIVDGPFVEELKDGNIRFRGSQNQRIITLM